VGGNLCYLNPNESRVGRSTEFKYCLLCCDTSMVNTWVDPKFSGLTL